MSPASSRPPTSSTLHSRILLLVSTIGLLLGGRAPLAQETSRTPDTPEALITEYIRLYSAASLVRWRELFHPALVVTDPAPDGSIRVRDLEAFFQAQQERFEEGHRVSERLEHVRVTRGRRIASATADFVFSLDGSERRGKLGLQLGEGQEGWKVVALVYAYDSP